MTQFIVILILLILSVVFFFAFPFIKRSLLKRRYNKLFSLRCKSICRKNDFYFLNNINVESSSSTTKVDQIIFGNKYIYIIKNHCYFGIISGQIEDNSWIFLNKLQKQGEYIENPYKAGSDRIAKFSRLAKLDPSILIDIELFNNECDARIEKAKTGNVFVTTPFKLLKLIEKFEQSDIALLNKEQLKITMEEVRRVNEEQRKYKNN